MKNLKTFSKSWDLSMKECRRLIQYIMGTVDQPGLVPHKVQDTVSVNEARRVIQTLAQPLAEMTENINDNLVLLEEHKREVEKHRYNKNKLSQMCSVTHIELKINQLEQPRTVCTSTKCIATHYVAGMRKVIYKTVCCDPCTLKGVTKDVLGEFTLSYCQEMNYRTGLCMKCSCSYEKHMHIYYETTLVENKATLGLVRLFMTESKALNHAEQMLADISERQNIMKNEMQVITKATAKFAHFLKNNAIVPHNESFKVSLSPTFETYLVFMNKNRHKK